MQYLHWEVNAGPNTVVRVELSKQANVMLLDDSNYSSYRHGGQYRYFGGHATHSPVMIPAPHSGRWHVV
jgi:hypothetical protein